MPPSSLPTLPRTESFWTRISGPALAQGDYLLDCPLPVFPADYVRDATDAVYPVKIERANLIVITQSCDLENTKIGLAAMCPIYTVPDLEKRDPKILSHLEYIRRGWQVAYHLLSSPEKPDENMEARIVDFREIYSLPVDYLTKHAEVAGNRWRLRPPYLEHFSQAFARYFMRVGLPSTIQPFTGKK